MKVISVINLKGGVSKTTTAQNMAYILATHYNKRVLVLDNDKQGNISKAFGVYDADSNQGVHRIMTEIGIGARVCEVIMPTKYENIQVIPTNMQLLNANRAVLLDCTRPQQTRFKSALINEQMAAVYDYLIIDNAPDINVSIINALAITDDVIIPIVIDDYSLDGMNILIDTIKDVKGNEGDEYRLNAKINFCGCLITNYQRCAVEKSAIDEIRSSVKTFNTIIRHTNGKVQESTFEHIPVSEHSSRCGASQDYRKFIREYLGEEA